MGHHSEAGAAELAMTPAVDVPSYALFSLLRRFSFVWELSDDRRSISAVRWLCFRRGQSIDCAIEVLRELSLDSSGINLICDCLSFFVSPMQTGCVVERAPNLDYEGSSSLASDGDDRQLFHTCRDDLQCFVGIGSSMRAITQRVQLAPFGSCRFCRFLAGFPGG